MNLFKKTPAVKAAPGKMKVYRDIKEGFVPSAMVSPGVDHPEVAEWFDTVAISASNGGGSILTARMMAATFANGEAVVDERIGRYMIKHELALKKPAKKPQVLAG